LPPPISPTCAIPRICTISSKAARPNDHRPLYCLNQVGVPKRPEIKAADFAKALDDEPVAIIPFEPQLFGAAANNGQMIAEISSGHRTAEMFRQLAQKLTGRIEPKKQRSGLLSPLFEKLLQRLIVTVNSVGVAFVFGKRPLPVVLRPPPVSGGARRKPAPRPAAPPAASPAAAPSGTGGRAVSVRRSRRADHRRADAKPECGRPYQIRRRQVPTAVDTRRSESYYEVKGTIFGALIEAIDLGQLAKLDADSAREEIRDIVNEIIAIKNIVMSIAEQEDLLDDICNDVLGYGPLEPLLARDEIADIMVNGSGTVYIEVAGKIQKTGIRFRDNQQLLNICQRIVSQVGRRVDESSPICDARLPDGSRVNAIVPPLAIDGPALTIRKFKKDKLTLEQLVRYGTISPEGAEILKVIGRCRSIR
jgi:hypothetical protein